MYIYDVCGVYVCVNIRHMKLIVVRFYPVLFYFIVENILILLSIFVHRALYFTALKRL